MENLWYKRIGFETNPFSIKPIHFNDNLQSSKTNQLLEKIALGKILFIEGEYGTGKSSTLQAIIKKFGGKKQILYYNCNTTEDSIDFQNLFKKRHNWFQRMFGAKAKNMILLLDEAQNISEEDTKKLLELHEQGRFKSIVLVAKKSDITLTEYLKETIDTEFKTEKITKDQALELIKTRIGELPLLPPEAIQKIYLKSSNPRNFLENCEDVCYYAVSNNIEVIDSKTITSALK